MQKRLKSAKQAEHLQWLIAMHNSPLIIALLSACQ